MGVRGASRAGLPFGGPERALRALHRDVLLARSRRSFAEGPPSLLRLLEQLIEAPAASVVAWRAMTAFRCASVKVVRARAMRS